MGLKGKNSHIIDKIININQQDIDKILPKKIENNKCNWKYNKNELFVDFETLSDIFVGFDNLPKQESSDMIFMIGVGWYEDNIWKYKNYICNESTYEEEYRIMNEFSIFVHSRNNPTLNYWYADSFFWKKAESRQFDLASCRLQKKEYIR